MVFRLSASTFTKSITFIILLGSVSIEISAHDNPMRQEALKENNEFHEEKEGASLFGFECPSYLKSKSFWAFYTLCAGSMYLFQEDDNSLKRLGTAVAVPGILLASHGISNYALKKIKGGDDPTKDAINKEDSNESAETSTTASFSLLGTAFLSHVGFSALAKLQNPSQSLADNQRQAAQTWESIRRSGYIVIPVGFCWVIQRYIKF